MYEKLNCLNSKQRKKLVSSNFCMKCMKDANEYAESKLLS